jgi:hypothetical protein
MFKAADFDGRSVGQAFQELVIGDPAVKAAGERLCLKCPEFDPLFREGKFPIQIWQSKSFRGHRPHPEVNFGYSDQKKYWRGSRGVLSDLNRTSTPTRTKRPQFSFEWNHKWPLALDAKELAQKLSGEDDTNADYWRHPFSDPISDAISLLADRHQRFFDLLRTGRLVAEGIFRNGQELPLTGKEWGRPDRYLDVQSSDLCNKKGETWSVLWESVTLRFPNQNKRLKPQRPRPVDQALERELKKQGLADGRDGKTDHEIACAAEG